MSYARQGIVMGPIRLTLDSNTLEIHLEVEEYGHDSMVVDLDGDDARLMVRTLQGFISYMEENEKTQETEPVAGAERILREPD